MEFCSFYPVPVEIAEDTELGAADIRLLYGAILLLSTKSGFCHASNEYLSQRLRCHRRTISSWIKRLKERNYIRVEYDYAEDNKAITQRRIYPNIGISPTANEGTSTDVEGTSTDVGGIRPRMKGVYVHGRRGYTSTDEGEDIKLRYKVKIKEEDTTTTAAEFVSDAKLPPEIISALDRSGIMLTPTTADKLASWVGDMEVDVVIYAIEQADAHGKRNVAYIEGILRRLKSEGINTSANLKSSKSDKSVTEKLNKKSSNPFLDMLEKDN